MKTSSFAWYQGPGRISIARSVPLYTPPGYRLYRGLAPEKDMLKMSHDDYHERYQQILRRLDPKETWDELHRLAGGAEPVLLCWESLTLPCEWCHRRMTARWFEAELGVEVSELTEQFSLDFG